jgi:hypothetical protein
VGSCDPGPRPAARIVDEDEALTLLPRIYERVRGEIPGLLARSARGARRSRSPTTGARAGARSSAPCLFLQVVEARRCGSA